MALKIDCKGHVVLGEFGETAVLFVPENVFTPFVEAFGYDFPSGEWSHGSYSSNPGTAWNQADPDVYAHLSEPVTRNFLRDVFNGIDYEPSDDEIDEFADSLEQCVWHDDYSRDIGETDDVVNAVFNTYAIDHGFREYSDTCNCCEFYDRCPDDENVGYCVFFKQGDSRCWRTTDSKPCKNFIKKGF